MKIQKKFFEGGGVGQGIRGGVWGGEGIGGLGQGGRVGGQGRWERRSEACVKIQKKKLEGGVGGQAGCEWRSEAFL